MDGSEFRETALRAERDALEAEVATLKRKLDEANCCQQPRPDGTTCLVSSTGLDGACATCRRTMPYPLAIIENLRAEIEERKQKWHDDNREHAAEWVRARRTEKQLKAENEWLREAFRYVRRIFDHVYEFGEPVDTESLDYAYEACRTALANRNKESKKP